MAIIKRILVLTGTLILIKVIFFIAYHAFTMQTHSEAVSTFDNQQITQVSHQDNSPAAEPGVAALSYPARSAVADNVSSPGYRRYTIDRGISVELPENWSLLSDNQIMGIKHKAGTAHDIPSNTIIAANSDHSARLNEGVFRVSITEGNFTAEALKTARSADLDELCNHVNDSLMTRLSAQNETVTRRADCSISSITNKPALLIRYQRTDLNSAGAWNVSIYQVPVNSKILIFTTSYKKNGTPQIQTQLTAILHSVKWD